MGAIVNEFDIGRGIQAESDVTSGDIHFNHSDDRAFWCSVYPPCYQCVISMQDSKTFSNIKNRLQQQFPHVHNLQQIIRFLGKCFGNSMDNEDIPVRIRMFIQQTKWFGSLTRVGDSCTFLRQTQKLMSYTLDQEGQSVSPFAGKITQEEAEDYLRDTGIGTYLIRLSEGKADQGGYSLAVKATCIIVRHYRILGDPGQAAQDTTNYNARLKLVHNVSPDLNAQEQEYPDIVEFLKNRLDDAIEDNIYCRYVCPNLPFNEMFRGH
ncbi:uncharacterized protein LOC120332379 [Styela clava]